MRAYDDLYTIIRRSQDQEARLIIQNIRSGVDVETIVRMIQEGDLLLQLSLRPEWRFRYEFPGTFPELPLYLNQWPNPYLSSTVFQKSLLSTTQLPDVTTGPPETANQDSLYVVPYHVATMADPRLDSVDVTRYTTVCSDNSLLRSLLEIYFLFEFPFNSFFHIDIFLDDMASGQDNYCSPVLVNAVLASAWVCIK